MIWRLCGDQEDAVLARKTPLGARLKEYGAPYFPLKKAALGETRMVAKLQG